MALTAKQEAFCQAIVSGNTQADAYRKAYNANGMKATTIQVKASELMSNGKIAVRIDEIRAPAIKKIQYGLVEAMAEADEAMEICRGAKQGGAFVAAVQLRSKLNGLLVEKKEILHGSLDGLSPEKKREALEFVRAAVIQRKNEPRQSVH